MPAPSKTSPERLRLLQDELGGEVLIAGAKLAPEASPLLVHILVDLHVGLPDCFELTFRDPTFDVLTKAGLAIGKVIQVRGEVINETAPRPLIEGEVTSIEGNYGDMDAYTVVRGYTLDHRLQRVRRTRTFLNMKDSDLARKLAGDAGLTVGTIDPTTQVHPQVAQDNQTDWQLLRERAEETGFEVGVREGKFYFRKAVKAATGVPVAVYAGEEILRFSPRVSSSSLVDEVEVRAWDPVNAKAVAVRKPIAASGVSIGAGTPVATAKLFASTAAAPPPASSEMGPAPSPKAQVVFDRALTVDNNSTQALTEAADALAESAASGFAEADGQMIGDARIAAGAVLDVKGVPMEFEGKWTVTRARHEFDRRPGGSYVTWFAVSGRQDRSLLALADGGGNNDGPPRVQGVVGGIVTSLDDPLGLARVKVALPWLSPDYETAWAPVIQLMAGATSGAMFLPEPGDQVLVSFEFGDLRRPYVLGSVVNTRTGAGGCLEPGGTKPGEVAIKPGKPSAVALRGLVTPTQSRLVFHDEMPPAGGKPTAAQLIFTTAEDKMGMVVDAVTGEMSLLCTPGAPPGRLVIECDGTVEITAGATGTLTIDGGQMLTLKGQSVQIEGTGPVAVKGKPVQLN